MKNLTDKQKEYLNYLENLRNDFYDRGLNDSADKVQLDIQNLLNNTNWK